MDHSKKTTSEQIRAIIRWETFEIEVILSFIRSIKSLKSSRFCTLSLPSINFIFKSNWSNVVLVLCIVRDLKIYVAEFDLFISPPSEQSACFFATQRHCIRPPNHLFARSLHTKWSILVPQFLADFSWIRLSRFRHCIYYSF